MAFLIVLFILFLSHLTCAINNCPASTCSGNGFQIRFPFTLQSQEHQNNCGFPGFELTCNNHSKTVSLNLPSSGKFFVRNINYSTQNIYLYDPYNCLSRRLLNLTLWDSPFTSVYSQKYTFLSCPSEFMKSSVTPIHCLSNSTHNIIATDLMFLAPLMPPCEKIGTLEIPVSSKFQYMPFSEMSEDLELKWDVPKCKVCEARGGVCGFKNSVSHEVTCSKSGINWVKVLEIVTLSITLPAITCVIGIALSRCITTRIMLKIRSNATNQSLNPPPVSIMQLTISSTTAQDYEPQPLTLTNPPLPPPLPPPPPPPPLLRFPPRRLVRPSQPQPPRQFPSLPPLSPLSPPRPPTTTIEPCRELYVQGDSRQIPGPNSSTCPICLSEYNPTKALKFIPECNHCFHVECIDEWLRLKNSCPVCRISLFPSPSPSPISPSSSWDYFFPNHIL